MDIKTLKGQRAYKKGVITLDLKALSGLDPSNITVHLLEQVYKTISDSLVAIEDLDLQISMSLTDPELTSEVEAARKYHLNIQIELAKLKDKMVVLQPISVNSNTQAASPALPQKIIKLPLPPVQLATFKDNLENPFAYYNFKKSFINCLAGMPSLTNSQKLIYLKGYLAGEALNLVENLLVEDARKA